jgi:hypothetical protein
VYWVHIEFVYGRVSILPKHRVGIPMASVGLAVISVAMVGLAYYRTRMKDKPRRAEVVVEEVRGVPTGLSSVTLPTRH